MKSKRTPHFMPVKCNNHLNDVIKIHIPRLDPMGFDSVYTGPQGSIPIPVILEILIADWSSGHIL